MRLFSRILFTLILTLIAAAAFGSGKVDPRAASFDAVRDRVWALVEVRGPGGADLLAIDRAALDPGAFTLTFDGERVHGAAAPNRYFAPYRAEGDHGLAIERPASTMMMALGPPPPLAESDFFDRLAAASRWDLREGRLEIAAPDGRILVFE